MICDAPLLQLIPKTTFLKKRKDSEFSILLSEQNLEQVYLDSSSEYFFSLIDGQRTVSDIISLLEQEFDADRETLQNDYISFLRDLQWKRLIKFQEKKRD